MVRRNSLLKSFYIRPTSPVSSSSDEDTPNKRRNHSNFMDVDMAESTQPTTPIKANNNRSANNKKTQRPRLTRSASVSAIDGIAISEEFRTKQYVEISDDQLDYDGDYDGEHEKYMKWATEMLKTNQENHMSIDQPTTSRGRTLQKAPIKRRVSRRRATISPEVVDMSGYNNYQPQASKKKRGRTLKKTDENSASNK
jgi:hypothetical protein